MGNSESGLSSDIAITSFSDAILQRLLETQQFRFNQDFKLAFISSQKSTNTSTKLDKEDDARQTLYKKILLIKFERSELKKEIESDAYLRKTWQIAVKENKISQVIEEMDYKTLVALIKYVYTCESGFYQQLNVKLRTLTDTSFKSFPYKHYVKLMLDQIQAYSSKIELYRCVNYKMKAEVGDCVFTDQFESCSTNKEVAIKYFLVAGGSLFIITTNKSIPILNDSKFQLEKEHLLPPGVGGKIKSIVDKTFGMFGQSSYSEVKIELLN